MNPPPRRFRSVTNLRSVQAVGPLRHPSPGAHLVVGHCRDAASDAALEVAADLAVRLHAELHVVHCVDLSDYPIDPDAHDWDAQAQAALAEEQRHVEQVLVEHPGRWTYHAAHGHPVALLAQVADEQDALFIVVGTHGEGFSPAMRRLIHGRSVSHGLIRRKCRPVLVVTAPESAATSEPDARPGRTGRLIPG